MNETAFFNWLHGTHIGAFARDVTWAWPLLETVHFIGLCMLIGALLVVDLRVLGVGKREVPIASVTPFSFIAFSGLALNVITGVAFFCAKPFNYWSNDAFKWKMALVLVGALNAIAFEFLERRRLIALPIGADTGLSAKLIAGLSLSIWIVVIVLGRILPFTGSSIG